MVNGVQLAVVYMGAVLSGGEQCIFNLSFFSCFLCFCLFVSAMEEEWRTRSVS